MEIIGLFGEQVKILAQWLGLSAFMFLRYALFAGIPFVLFYVLLKDKLSYKKIQQKHPKMSKVWEEVKHSSQTSLIFGFLSLVIYLMTKQGWTMIYSDFSEYSVMYALLSFVVMVFIHDAYFYWIHFAMHKSKFLMRFHAIHHKSHNPTPWAVLAFHPIDALLEFAFLPFILFLMPFHPLVLVLFGTWSYVWNVIGHLGFEIFPSGFTKHPFFQWFNTSTHHNMHHKNGSRNFGLYFNIWDRLIGTNHKNYLVKFDEVSQRAKKVVEIKE